MPLAHDFADDVLRALNGLRTVCLHDDAIQSVPRVGEATHMRVERGDDLTVEREAEYRALLLEHADHGEREAIDAQLAANRIKVREVAVGDFGPDDDDRRPGVVLLVGEK